MKVKVKDKVLVISGKYKGKTGTVMRVFKKTNRLTVEKINIRTRHIKKTATHAGQRIQYEAPFDASNVQVICPNCNKPTRVAYSAPSGTASKKTSATKQIKKYRVCRKCHESLEQAITKAESKKK